MKQLACYEMDVEEGKRSKEVRRAAETLQEGSDSREERICKQARVCGTGSSTCGAGEQKAK